MSNAAAPQRKPGEANPIVQLAILVAILAVVLNVGFYFISESYFQDRISKFGLQELARLSGARRDFGIFTAVVGGGVIAAAAYPRWVAHLIPAIASVLSFAAALAVFAKDRPVVLGITLLVTAGVFDLVIWQSQWKRARASWAVLMSMCIVFGIVMLFAAPKLRGELGIGLWIAMIVPGAFGVAIASLGLIAKDYGEPAEHQAG